MHTPIARQQAHFGIQRFTQRSTIQETTTIGETIEIYLVLNGKMTIDLHGTAVRLTSGELSCALLPDSATRSHEVQPGANGYLIRFNKSLLYCEDYEFYCTQFSTFLAFATRNEVIRVVPAFLQEARQLCHLMHQEYRQQVNAPCLQILTSYLSIFLLQLMRRSDHFSTASGNETQHAVVRRFHDLVEAKYKDNKKVNEYANMLSMTPSHLNKIIKQATGKSASTLIRERLILEAVRQVKQTGASMKEISYSLGFNDNAHFSKFFKREVGTNFSNITKYNNSKYLFHPAIVY